MLNTSKQLKNQSELIEDLQKENKTQKYEEAKIKISVLNDKISQMQKQLEEKENKYDIPKGLEAKVQYGAYIKALMCYLTTEIMALLNKTQIFLNK